MNYAYVERTTRNVVRASRVRCLEYDVDADMADLRLPSLAICISVTNPTLSRLWFIGEPELRVLSDLPKLEQTTNIPFRA